RSECPPPGGTNGPTPAPERLWWPLSLTGPRWWWPSTCRSAQCSYDKDHCPELMFFEVCVRRCVCVCAWACVCVCVRVCACACECVCGWVGLGGGCVCALVRLALGV